MERLTERYVIAPDGESDVWVKQHDYILAARKLCDYEDLEERLHKMFDCCYDINLYACICPSCGLHIIDFSDDDVDSKCNSDNPEDMFRSSMVHHAYIGMNNYCNRCGQKLDWGEENGR